MRTPHVAIGLAISATLLVAQNKTSVVAVVTVAARHGAEVPALKPADLTVTVHGERTPVSTLTPLTGPEANLELFLLIDDSIDSSLGSQFEELRHFIQNQPPTSKVGVAYMARGSATILQPLTLDHSASAQSLRLPNWRGGPSPYESVHDLTKHWPASSPNARREIIMISSGADATENPEPYDPSLDTAIQDAQRTGIVVYTIYAPSGRNTAQNSSSVSWSQSRLSRLASETGGESYLPPSGAAVTFQPYLAGIATRLQHQYRATFPVKSGTRDELRDIRISTEVPNTAVTAPRKIWVPAQH